MKWYVSAKSLGPISIPAGSAPVTCSICITVTAGSVGAAILRAENVLATWKAGFNFEIFEVCQANLDEPEEETEVVSKTITKGH